MQVQQRRAASPRAARKPRIAVAVRLAAAAAVVAALGACDQGSAPGAAVVPARSGEVWEIDRASDRAAAPAALIAYVNGLHVTVIDGDTAYAGMTRVPTKAGANGARSLSLAGGVEATLVQAGDAFELRFATGESVPLRRQQRKGS